jgi:hypothetical protein
MMLKNYKKIVNGIYREKHFVILAFKGTEFPSKNMETLTEILIFTCSFVVVIELLVHVTCLGKGKAYHAFNFKAIPVIGSIQKQYGTI